MRLLSEVGRKLHFQGKYALQEQRCDAALREAQGALQSLQAALDEIRLKVINYGLDFEDTCDLMPEELAARRSAAENNPKNASRMDAYVKLFELADIWNRKSPEIRTLVSEFTDKRAPNSIDKLSILELDALFAPLSDPENGWNKAHVNGLEVSDSTIFLNVPEFSPSSRSVREWKVATGEVNHALAFVSVLSGHHNNHPIGKISGSIRDCAQFAAHNFTEPRINDGLRSIRPLIRHSM